MNIKLLFEAHVFQRFTRIEEINQGMFSFSPCDNVAEKEREEKLLDYI